MSATSHLIDQLMEAGLVRTPMPEATRYEKSITACFIRRVGHAFVVTFDETCHGVYRCGDHTAQIGEDYATRQVAEEAATHYNEVAAGIGVATGDWPL